MNNFDIKQLIKSIQAHKVCPYCHSHYQRDNITILGCIDNTCMVYLECKVCGNNVLSYVTIIEDSSSKPATRFHLKEPITSDDLINLHQFLKDFDGDFKKIFDQIK